MVHLRVTVIEKKLLAKRVLECTIKYNAKLTLHPGQYIQLRIGDEWRPFTVATNRDKSSARIIVQLVEGTITKKFFNRIKVGDSIVAQKPQGGVLEPIGNDTVFVATGTGIIPLVEIAKHTLETEDKYKVRIIFGTRERKNLFYLNELHDLEDKYDNCKVIIAMSRAHEGWDGFSGRASEYIKENFKEIHNADFYVCGREETVADIMKLLHGLGVPKEQRHLIE